MRRHENEPFVVNREVQAVIVPAGQEVQLKPGQAGYITQALGGSFTVYIEGNLFRISGEDADAIGKEAVKAPELPPNATEEDVREARLGADAHLLRPRDPDQHRGPRTGLRLRGEAERGRHAHGGGRRSPSPPPAAAWATSWWTT